MGCDIHMMAEIRKADKWEKVSNVFESMYGDVLTDEPYDGRSYNLFAILADVRNGIGFAGIKTGEGFVPISNPKGVPKDASVEYLKLVSDWDGDGHSHSYFTLKELMDYDWGQYTMLQGCVSIDSYRVCKEKQESPSSYCGYISGGGIVLVDEEELPSNPDATHVKMRWEKSYKEAVGRFYTHTIPALQRLGDPESVRIVFFFDN